MIQAWIGSHAGSVLLRCGELTGLFWVKRIGKRDAVGGLGTLNGIETVLQNETS